jgi:hypothetical protein
MSVLPARSPDCPAFAIFFPNVVLLSCPSCQTVRLHVQYLRFFLFVVFLSCPSCQPVLLPVLPAYPPCLSSLPVLTLCDFLWKCRPPFLSFLSPWVPACLAWLSCICYFLFICRPPFLSFLSVLTACPAFAFFYPDPMTYLSCLRDNYICLSHACQHSCHLTCW